MKKIILAVLISSFSVGAFATDYSICTQQGQMAKSIMSIRQGGILTAMELIEKLVPSSKEVSPGTKRANDETMDLIIKAYDQPLYSTKEIAMETIKEFSNKVYIDCMKK